MEKGQSKSSIHKLIEISKKIREGTAEKEKYSVLLRNLNFFVNFCQLVYDKEEGVRLFFKVTQKLLSTPLGETLVLSIENSTTELTFSSTHWSFWLQQETSNGTRNCSTLNLANPLSPGGVERLSVPLPLQAFYGLTYKLCLVFTLSFNDTHFQRIFPCGRVEVDILHVLSHGKRLDALPPMDPLLLLNCRSTKSAQRPRTPPSVKFEFKANETLRKEFLRIFLGDAAHRGFSLQLFHPQSAHPESATPFVAFVGSEEVRVEIGTDRIVLRTFSQALLEALKQGIFTRLHNLDGVRLKGPGDAHWDELYRLKLRLSSPTAVDVTGRGEATVESELEESYLLLRKVTEGLEFSLEAPLPPFHSDLGHP